MTQTHRSGTAGGPPEGHGGAIPAPPVPPPNAPGTSVGERTAGRVGLALILGGLLALGVLVDWIYVWVILGIVVMIFLHELGHFVTAKWSGMKVTEFFFSFGPRIWSFRRGETEYGIKAVPAGAYVRIIGMNNLDEVDPADEPRTYRRQSFPKRLLVVSAGSIMHFLQAGVLLVLALGVFGVPGGSIIHPDRGDVAAWPVGMVTQDSPAGRAGLESGDRIVAVDGRPVDEFSHETGLRAAVQQHDVGDRVTFTVERDGRERTVDAELGARPANVEGGRPGTAYLGVSSGIEISNEAIGLGPAVARAPGEMVGFVGQSFKALGGVFSPAGLSSYAHNVGTGGESSQTGGGSSGGGQDNRLISIFGAVRAGGQIGEQGIGELLIFFFSLNVFIGIVNMVPLPPLDGGHAAVAIYERVRSRRGQRYQVDMTKLLPLTYAVVLVLVMLGATALYLDIVNPIPL